MIYAGRPSYYYDCDWLRRDVLTIDHAPLGIETAGDRVGDEQIADVASSLLCGRYIGVIDAEPVPNSVAKAKAYAAWGVDIIRRIRAIYSPPRIGWFSVPVTATGKWGTMEIRHRNRQRWEDIQDAVAPLMREADIMCPDCYAVARSPVLWEWLTYHLRECAKHRKPIMPYISVRVAGEKPYKLLSAKTMNYICSRLHDYGVRDVILWKLPGDEDEEQAALDVVRKWFA